MIAVYRADALSQFSYPQPRTDLCWARSKLTVLESRNGESETAPVVTAKVPDVAFQGA
jgi:hypothetical protein